MIHVFDNKHKLSGIFPSYERMRYCPSCENIVSNPKLVRCLCTYCEFCLQSLRKDDKVTCLVCKQESIFREESVDDYTYHHSMIIHDNLLEFDQPTFECAVEIMESMESLYPKGNCHELY